MISEINRKISSDIEGKEDLLTGTFFGPIRYTKNFGELLGKILHHVRFSDDKEEINLAEFKNDLTSIAEREDFDIHFWEKYDLLEGKKEPDLIIKDDKFIICIEVKYQSGLSGPQQLVNYANALRKTYNSSERIWLILLAKEPYAKDITVNHDEIEGIAGLGFLSWQQIHISLSRLTDLNGPSERIRKDLVDYLAVKNLKGFLNFPVEDYKKYPDFKSSRTQLLTLKNQFCKNGK